MNGLHQSKEALDRFLAEASDQDKEAILCDLAKAIFASASQGEVPLFDRNGNLVAFLVSPGHREDQRFLQDPQRLESLRQECEEPGVPVEQVHADRRW
ncbi:MAG TPA: hypothetical protein VFE62_18000 [Gemmataceae bacterium]|nr:hypothetical protein [Gemmataceae bacterium]